MKEICVKAMNVQNIWIAFNREYVKAQMKPVRIYINYSKAEANEAKNIVVREGNPLNFRNDCWQPVCWYIKEPLWKPSFLFCHSRFAWFIVVWMFFFLYIHVYSSYRAFLSATIIVTCFGQSRLAYLAARGAIYNYRLFNGLCGNLLKWIKM